MELLLTAAPITAQRAMEIGLVNQVVHADDLHNAAQGLARTILANAPLSVRAAKATVLLGARAALNALQDEADEVWDPVYRSADAREGPAAFRAKRPPRWTGR